MTDDDDAKAKERPGSSASGRNAQAERAARLAAALKANLGKRKAAARSARAGERPEIAGNEAAGDTATPTEDAG